MARLDDVLNPDEKVVFRTRLHWLACAPFALLLAAVCLAILVAFLVFGRHLVADSFQRQPLAAAIATLVLVLFILVPLFVVRFLVATHEFAVTDRRVIACTGWVNTRTVDLSVAKVESLVIEQTASGRMFGYGDLKLTGTGGTEELFRAVKDPVGFRKAVNLASDRLAGRTAGA